jgi:predicted CXXCH cytochrome family protein
LEEKSIMRKNIILILVLALGIVLVSALAFAGLNPGTGIKQTSHDLSSATGKGALYNAGTFADGALDRICIYCHAPHHTMTTAEAQAVNIDYYPLWNHDITTITTYTTYSNTYDGTIPNSTQHQLNAVLGQPGSVSKLCLSCHDASVAVSSYGHFDGGASSSQHTGNVLVTATLSGRFGIGVGGNLQNHHPIGFDYVAVSLIDDEIRDASSTLLGNNPYGLTINDLLWQNKMECSSCHDVHNTKNTGLKFLWVEDTNSNLCFSCHKK